MLGRGGWAEGKNLPSWVGHIWWHCQVQLQQIFNLTTTTITRTFCDVGSLRNVVRIATWKRMFTEVTFFGPMCTRKTQPKAANFQVAQILVTLWRQTIALTCHISNQTRSNRYWEGLLGIVKRQLKTFLDLEQQTDWQLCHSWAKNWLTTKDWQQKDWQETDF